MISRGWLAGVTAVALGAMPLTAQKSVTKNFTQAPDFSYTALNPEPLVLPGFYYIFGLGKYWQQQFVGTGLGSLTAIDLSLALDTDNLLDIPACEEGATECICVVFGECAASIVNVDNRRLAALIQSQLYTFGVFVNNIQVGTFNIMGTILANLEGVAALQQFSQTFTFAAIQGQGPTNQNFVVRIQQLFQELPGFAYGIVGLSPSGSSATLTGRPLNGNTGNNGAPPTDPAAAPEPASVALVMTGLAAMGAARRRRKKAIATG